MIERYACRIILGEGWEYSRGCTFEYLTAMRTVSDAFDANLQPLTLERGNAMVRAAVIRMQSLGQDTDFLNAILGGFVAGPLIPFGGFGSEHPEQFEMPSTRTESEPLFKDQVLTGSRTP